MKTKLKDNSQTIELYLEIGDNEYKCYVNFDATPGHPGRYTGPWEDCYPAEPPELEVNSVIAIVGNKTESFTILLENQDFSDYVHSEVEAYLEAEAEAYVAGEEDYDGSRYYNSVW